MKIIMIEAPGVEGGRALALCNDDGSIIGRQIGCAVACKIGELPIATVTLHVDGETLTLGDAG